jgi:integrase
MGRTDWLLAAGGGSCNADRAAGGAFISVRRRRIEVAQEFMGHSTITMTFDTYGHLMPGSRDQVRERMDAYLEAAEMTGQP